MHDQALTRAGDPLSEVALPVMTRMEDGLWAQTLTNAAAPFKVADVRIAKPIVCGNARWRWRTANSV